jgi:hypothetical protein
MLDATIATLAAHLTRSLQKPLIVILNLSSWMDDDPRHHSLRSQRFVQLFQHLAPLAIFRNTILWLCGHHLVVGREELHAVGGALGRSVGTLTNFAQVQWRDYSSDQEIKADLKAAFPSLRHYFGYGREAAESWSFQ